MSVLPVIAVPAACVLLLIVGSTSAVAQDSIEEDNGFLSAPAPAAPSRATAEDLIEPEVTIIETDDQVIYEYRANGRLYMVKIQPMAGPPYFMLDIDGDGLLDVQNQSPPELALPQWLLFSW
jgi:hypothetical protein